MTVAVEIVRMIAVIALLIVAAVLATPPGRMPLAMRGILRILRRDRGEKVPMTNDCAAPGWKRLVAFLLVLAAATLAMVRFS